MRNRSRGVRSRTRGWANELGTLCSAFRLPRSALERGGGWWSGEGRGGCGGNVHRPSPLHHPPPRSNAERGRRNAEQSVPSSFAQPRVRDRTPRDLFRIPRSAFRVSHALRLQCSTASAPANPKVASTQSVPTQSPSRTYGGITSLERSRPETAASTSRPVAA